MTAPADPRTATLYQLFTTILLFPSTPENTRDLESLVARGYAEPATQGHAEGYRISPAGWREAMSRWGVKQQEALS